MSPGNDGENRREHRIEAAFRVRYQSLYQLVEALTHDVSRGGLFMRTVRFLPINAIVRVELELPDGGGELPVICRVAFVRGPEEAAASGKPAGMGVEFLDLDDKRLADILQRASQQADDVERSRRRPLELVIVDDDTNIRASVAAALRDRGDRVREAHDGLEALALCLKQPPDLLLTDVQMPRMDGWQLTRMVRARASLARVPIIMHTTLTDDAARMRGYRLGVDDYIHKPAVNDELILRVDRLLSRTQAMPATGERRSLRGDLEHVTLASVLSFLAMEQKTGILFIVADASARIFLRGGEPRRVEIDDVPVAGGDPALHELLGWNRGQFEFTAGDVQCDDELGTTVNALLLEHARRTDEASR